MYSEWSNVVCSVRRLRPTNCDFKPVGWLFGLRISICSSAGTHSWRALLLFTQTLAKLRECAGPRQECARIFGYDLCILFETNAPKIFIARSFDFGHDHFSTRMQTHHFGEYIETLIYTTIPTQMLQVASISANEFHTFSFRWIVFLDKFILNNAYTNFLHFLGHRWNRWSWRWTC